MLIFFAGSQGFEKIYPELKPYMKNRLLSYHYMTPSMNKYFLEERDPSLFLENLIMDSGAFSAWNQGVVIDFEAYLEYCRKYVNNITYVVNLDVIPAKPGQKQISQEEIERSASAGWKNAQRMLRGGIPKEKLIHVFHQNENFKWLERMVREFPYIGLSPANDRTTAEKMMWLDQCMPYVTDSEGKAIVKFHGFAVTSHALMMRYPWFSVDSASWCQQAGRGVIYIPPHKKGVPDYTKPWYSIRIGLNSPFERDAIHYNNLSPVIREHLFTYLHDRKHKLGVSSCRQLAPGEKKGSKGFLRFCRKREGCDQIVPKERCLEEVVEAGVYNSYRCRALVNAEYICDLQDTLIPWPDRPFAHLETSQQGFALL